MRRTSATPYRSPTAHNARSPTREPSRSTLDSSSGRGPVANPADAARHALPSPRTPRGISVLAHSGHAAGNGMGPTPERRGYEAAAAPNSGVSGAPRLQGARSLHPADLQYPRPSPAPYAYYDPTQLMQQQLQRQQGVPARSPPVPASRTPSASSSAAVSDRSRGHSGGRGSRGEEGATNNNNNSNKRHTHRSASTPSSLSRIAPHSWAGGGPSAISSGTDGLAGVTSWPDTTSPYRPQGRAAERGGSPAGRRREGEAAAMGGSSGHTPHHSTDADARRLWGTTVTSSDASHGAHNRSSGAGAGHLHHHHHYYNNYHDNRHLDAAQRSHQRTHSVGLTPGEAMRAAAAPSALACALGAQWNVLQAQMTQDAAAAGAAVPLRARAAAETELLATLSSRGEPAALARDVVADAAFTLPYLLAFAVAALPSLRTQLAALRVLHAALLEMPRAWGPEAAAQFVADFILDEHNAAEALEVAWHVLAEDREGELADVAAAATSAPETAPGGKRASEKSVAKRAAAGSGGGRMANGRQSAFGRHKEAAAAPERPAADRDAILQAARAEKHAHNRLKSAVVDGMCEVTYALVLLAPEAAGVALLSRPALVQQLLRCVAGGTPLQVACIGGTLLALTEVPDAAALLVSYGAQHTVLTHLRATLAGGSGGLFDSNEEGFSSADDGTGLESGATVTALCLFLRVAVRLTPCTAAFGLLYQEPSLTELLARLLRSRWADVAELAALWLAALLRCQPDETHGQLLARRLLEEPAAAAAPAAPLSKSGGVTFARALSRLLTWRQVEPCGAAAALAWRWLLLCEPEAGARALLRDPSVLLAFVQALLDHPLSAESPGSQERAAAVVMAVETTLCLGLAAGLASGPTASGLRLLLARRLPNALELLAERAQEVFGALRSGDYFASFPAVVVSGGAAGAAAAELRESDAASAASEEHRMRSRSRSPPQQPRLETILNDPIQWRDFLYREVMTLFTEPSAAAASSPAAASRRRGGAPLFASLASLTAGGTVSAAAGSSQAPPLLLSQLASSASVSSLPYASLPVVRRAAAFGGSFCHDSIQVVLRLSAHYVQTAAERLSAREAAAQRWESAALSSLVAVAVAGHEKEEEDDFSYAPPPLQIADGYGGPDGALELSRLRRTALDVMNNTTTTGRHGGAGSNTVSTIHNADKSSLGADVSVLLQQRRQRQLERRKQRQMRNGDQNPYAPPPPVSAARVTKASATPANNSRKAGGSGSGVWQVADLQRSDVLLFAVDATNLTGELPQALKAVEEHLRQLQRLLQTCPTRQRRRRLVLNDLYTHVYPRLHGYLDYMRRRAAVSGAAVAVLEEASGGLVHSGNILELYEACRQCGAEELAD